MVMIVRLPPPSVVSLLLPPLKLHTAMTPHQSNYCYNMLCLLPPAETYKMIDTCDEKIAAW